MQAHGELPRALKGLVERVVAQEKPDGETRVAQGLLHDTLGLIATLTTIHEGTKALIDSGCVDSMMPLIRTEHHHLLNIKAQVDGCVVSGCRKC